MTMELYLEEPEITEDDSPAVREAKELVKESESPEDLRQKLEDKHKQMDLTIETINDYREQAQQLRNMAREREKDAIANEIAFAMYQTTVTHAMSYIKAETSSDDESSERREKAKMAVRNNILHKHVHDLGEGRETDTYRITVHDGTEDGATPYHWNEATFAVTNTSEGWTALVHVQGNEDNKQWSSEII